MINRYKWSCHHCGGSGVALTKFSSYSEFERAVELDHSRNNPKCKKLIYTVGSKWDGPKFEFLWFDEETQWSKENMSINSRRANELGVLLSMAGILADPYNKSGIRASQKKIEDDPKWNGVVKLEPTECFISVGPGAIEDEFYPCLMKPDPKEESGFKLLAKLKWGYATADEARNAASKMMKSVPVLQEDGSFTYPHYDYRPEDISCVTKAEERRARKAEKRRADAEKRERGLYYKIQRG